MKRNFSKYLILILAALFFASTNEMDAKEAEQNYKTESHSFIESDNFNQNILSEQNDNGYSKANLFSSTISFQSYYLNLIVNSANNNHPKLPAKFFSKDIYLDISVLRI